jgi:uncharacterized protein (TIGR02594 family)
MEKLIRTAAYELGIREIVGVEHNPRILKYSSDIGMLFTDDETAWCSIFLNWVAYKSKFERSESEAARSWQNIGHRVADPEPGDVAIFWRGSPRSWKGHVGLFMGFSVDKSRVYVLGGNQQNAVSITAKSIDQLIEFRRLRRLDVRLSNKTLQIGNKGPEVALLQDALKMAGFNCGTSDGDFGPRTKRAVKDLQRTNNDLSADGIFGPDTKTHLKSLITSE